jgi:SAM-dependent methyltransferase
MRPDGWRFEERDCPICAEGWATAIPLGRRGGAAHHLALGRETGIVRCRRCHAVYPLPMPLPAGNPYLDHPPETYFAGHDSTDKVSAGERLACRAEEILGTRGRLLEIGCGRGELLRGAANRGWEVQGVDMTEPFARVAKDLFGVLVEVSPAETAQALREQWDVVVLAAVLEHVYDPMALLQRVHVGLRRGGVVFIDVPNECSFYSRLGNLYLRLTGKDWAINLSPTFPPFHVVGFCPASLKWALGRTGFSPIQFELYKMEGSLIPRDRSTRARIEAAGLELSLALGQSLGMGAGITCWARSIEP